jgi:hypothetical protein
MRALRCVACVRVQSVRRRFPSLRPCAVACGLWSPHELRVESRAAIPALAAWLEVRA